MARVTIEDCLPNVSNRFDLVLLAAKRARQLASGRAEPTIDSGHDKYTVVALREIAAGTITAADIDAIETQQAAGPANVDLAAQPFGEHVLAAIEEDFVQH